MYYFCISKYYVMLFFCIFMYYVMLFFVFSCIMSCYFFLTILHLQMDGEFHKKGGCLLYSVQKKVSKFAKILLYMFKLPRNGRKYVVSVIPFLFRSWQVIDYTDALGLASNYIFIIQIQKFIFLSPISSKKNNMF